MGKTKTTRSRPVALSRAEHGGGPVHLTKEQRGVLEEALRLGTDLADEMGSKTTSYGRWLLETVFDDDASAALDDKSHNPVWLELVRRAGGPTLSLSRRMLYVALQLAAHDKQITDQAWQRLDAVRKEILLPIRDTRQTAAPRRRARQRRRHDVRALQLPRVPRLRIPRHGHDRLAHAHDLKPHATVTLVAPYIVGAVEDLCSTTKQTYFGPHKELDWDLCTFDVLPVETQGAVGPSNKATL
jgi:hypothetical protein